MVIKLNTIKLSRISEDPRVCYEEKLTECKKFFLANTVSTTEWEEIQNKLKQYEKLAIKENYLDDWYIEVRDAFELHFLKCDLSNIEPTINGFVKEIECKANLFFN